MQKLRSLHLYLGCVFAPLLLFFAVSAIWQTLGWHSKIIDRLSTIHTSHQLKTGDSLSSTLLASFVLLMALAFIATTVMGVLMAFRFGRNRVATLSCLGIGLAVPVVLVLARLVR